MKEPKILLEKALKNTLQKKRDFGGNPTVLCTGNGYHIYQPVAGFTLEEYETFYKFAEYLDKDLTTLFIQFAEDYFTNYAADHLHNPTVKSFLLRIPRSLNSKCIGNETDRFVLYKNGMVKDRLYCLSYVILEDGLYKRGLMVLKS